MIVFKCPSCKKKLQAAEDKVDNWIECLHCQATAKVPSLPVSSDATAITANPAETNATPDTAVTTPKHARKIDHDFADNQPRQRDGANAPKVGSGPGMSLLRIAVFGGGIFFASIIFLALLVAAVQKVREAAARAQGTHHLRIIGLAADIHLDAYKYFPSPRHQPKEPLAQGVKAPDLSWRISVLGFIEQGRLENQFDKTADWDHASNLQFLPMMPREYYCAAAGQIPPGTEQDTFFQYFTGPNTLFPNPLQKVGNRDILDGKSNTFFVAQAKRAVPWTKAEDMAVAPNLPLLLPNHIFLVLMADGTVKSVNRVSVDDATLRMFIDPRDGQEVQPGMLD